MKTLALLLLTVYATPSYASDVCTEDKVRGLQNGNLGIRIEVLTRALTLNDMYNDIGSQLRALKKGGILTPIRNLEISGEYSAYTKMMNFIKAEREKLAPCLVALKLR